MKDKPFKLSADQMRAIATGRGACLATDHITVDGHPVGLMYREQPGDPDDSGWRFFSGAESQDYVDDAENWAIYDVNTIANYDQEIVPLLDSPIGSAFERDGEAGGFVHVEIEIVE